MVTIVIMYFRKQLRYNFFITFNYLKKVLFSVCEHSSHAIRIIVIARLPKNRIKVRLKHLLACYRRIHDLIYSQRILRIKVFLTIIRDSAYDVLPAQKVCLGSVSHAISLHLTVARSVIRSKKDELVAILS